MTGRRLPPRDVRGRFVSPRRVATVAARDRARRRDRRSILVHWVAVVGVPWLGLLWAVWP